MARTVAGRRIHVSAETLNRAELHDIVIDLVDNGFLSMEEIEEGLHFVRQKRYIEKGIGEAISALPTYKFRDGDAYLMISKTNMRAILTKVDPFALVAFMDEESPPHLRVIIMDMTRESTPIRDWLKDKLLITHASGVLELRYFDEKPSKNDDSNPTKEAPPKALDASEQKALVIKNLIVQAIEILPSHQFEQIVGYIKQDNQLITQWLEGEWNAFKTLRQLVVDLVRQNKFIRQMLQEHLLKVLGDGWYVIDDDWD
ncbi:hypothetical protein DID88_001957 [Monilinia fructigena]|uniref:Uncharacterized protein n=1 Tax=Monilinia fructigena TaxID=38457 RepID=A0A395IWG9_9HELO|nr:hypothetical protein DID88_001957 [Monilinia fructigena]